MYDLAWTDERVAQLSKLKTLLIVAGSLNSSNDILNNIQLCIAISEELSRFNHETFELSFTQFLDHLAIKDREAAKSGTPAA